MNPSDNKVFRRNRSITPIGLFYKKWEDCGGCLTGGAI